MAKLPVIIGFAGRAGSGKDTTAALMKRELEVAGIKVTTDMVAAGLKAMLAVIGYPTPDTHTEKERVIPELGCTWRHLAQTLGTEWRSMVHPRLWMYSLEQRALQAAEHGIEVVLVTDVRHDFEAEFARSNGYLIHVEGPTTTASGHSSELPLLRQSEDFFVSNFERGDSQQSLSQQVWLIATLIREERQL